MTDFVEVKTQGVADYAELKRLAEACGDLNWRAIQENWCEWAIRDDHGYIATMRTKSAKHPGPCPDREAKAKFLCAVTPASVLSLIAENDRLKADHDLLMSNALPREFVKLRADYDQIKAENEALRLDVDRLQSATAFVQKLCDSAGKQPSVATGYLHDILSAMGKGEQS